jgi:hypothetical protein
MWGSGIESPGALQPRMHCLMFSPLPTCAIHLDCTHSETETPCVFEFSFHRSGDASLKDLGWEHRAWNGQQAYSDTKLHNVLLAFAIARRWPDVLSNALEPGWVPTKMGGPGAPDDLDAAHRTQVGLAASDDPAAIRCVFVNRTEPLIIRNCRKRYSTRANVSPELNCPERPDTACVGTRICPIFFREQWLASLPYRAYR